MTKYVFLRQRNSCSNGQTWMVVHWRYVSSFLVPVAMVVIGHEADPVQIFRQARHVVATVDHGLARGDGS